MTTKIWQHSWSERSPPCIGSYWIQVTFLLLYIVDGQNTKFSRGHTSAARTVKSLCAHMRATRSRRASKNTRHSGPLIELALTASVMCWHRPPLTRSTTSGASSFYLLPRRARPYYYYLCFSPWKTRTRREASYLVCSNAYVFWIDLHKLGQRILDAFSDGHCRHTQTSGQAGSRRGKPHREAANDLNQVIWIVTAALFISTENANVPMTAEAWGGGRPKPIVIATAQ